jgi:PAS domain S-box-containing protein
MHGEAETKDDGLPRFTNDAIVVFQGAKAVFWNKSYQKLTDFTEDEIRKNGLLQIIVPEDLSRFKECYSKRLKGEENTGTCEADIIVRSGKRISVEVTPFSIDYHGNPALVEIIRDVTELKKTKQELQRTKEMLDAVLDISPAGVCLMRSGILDWANNALHRMLGYEKDALAGSNAHILFPDVEEFERVDRSLHGRMEKTGRDDVEARMVRKDGETITCRVQARTPGKESAARDAILAAITDLSTRERLEKELKEAENRFRLITELSSSIFWTVSHDWEKMIYMSPSVEKICGHSCDAFYGEPELWFEIVHPADRHRVARYFKQNTESGKGVEYRIIRSDGAVCWVKNFTSRIGSEKGKPPLIAGLTYDITGKKRTEEALRDEREKYRILVDELPLGIALSDEDDRLFYLNSKFRDLFGYTLKEIPTRDVWFAKAYPEAEYRNTVVSLWTKDRKKLKDKKTTMRTLNIVCKDGSEKIVRVRSVKMKSGGYVTIYEDVTEQKNLEFQLLQAQKMEAIGTLASGIAHDFNNILAAIMGYAELVQLYISPDQREASLGVENILKAGHRAKELVKQILAFSRQREQGLKPVKISIIVEEALKLLRATLPTTIEIRKKISVGHDLILADPIKIHQVLMNLCTNAHHAMQETGGVLEVSLSDVVFDAESAAECSDLKPGAYVRLTIGDTGKGIDAGIMDRIFDPYFTTKEKGVGTGLGLSVVHGIAKNHGGSITVQSESGKGSSFHVFFPLIEGEEDFEVGSMEEIPRGNERILFVDDEELLADLGRRLLQHLGYDVCVRTSSIEALEAFRARPDRFDLVITDMAMPNMSGEILAKEIMKIRADVPIVLCTGYSELMTEGKAEKMGIRGFVMKPLVLRELAKIVRTALDG